MNGTIRYPRPIRRGRAARLGAALLAALAFAGCSEGGTPPPTPTIAVSLAAPTLSVHQGQNGTVAVSLERGGSYTGAVGLALEGAPTGVTGAFQPASLANGTAGSTLTLTVGPDVPAGTHTLTVRATGSGVSAHTAALALTVTVPPGITATLEPGQATVVQGANAAATVTITRTGGYTGPVDLALEGLPAGVTGSFNPATIPAGSTTSTLTLAAAENAAPGTATITVRGSGPGIAPRSASLPVTVAMPPGVALSISPGQIEAVQGSSGSTTVMITRIGGFAGPLTLSAENLPAGVTASFEPATIPASGSASTLTLTAAAGAATGESTVTLRATGEGIAARAMTIPLSVNAQPGFTLAFSPNAVSIAQNAKADVILNVTRTGGFTGEVTFDLGPAVPGLQGLFSFAPDRTTGNQTTLSIDLLSGTPTGSYDLVVVGRSAGLADRTATIRVTVVAPPPSFTLTVGPTGVTLPQGGTGIANVSIGRVGGFAGAVTLAVTGAPQGLTATLNPTSTTGNTSTLTLTAASNLAPGTYAMTVTATSPGMPNRTAQLQAQVQAASGGNSVTWEVCDEQDAPLWVAYRNESGPWTRVNGTNGRYTFTVGTRGGVAIVDAEQGIQVIYGTAGDLTAFGAASCALGSTGTKRLTGSVAGAGMTDMVRVQMGSAFAQVLAGTTAFVLDGVNAGAQDLIATRASLGTGGNTPSLAVNRFIIRRGLNLPNNAAIPVLNFEAAEAFAPVERTLTLTGLGSEQASVTASYMTASSSASVFGGLFGYFADMPSTAATRPYFAIPAAHQAQGDMHALFGMAIPAGNQNSLNNFRGTISYFRAATDRTLAFGPGLSAPAVTGVGGGTFAQLRAQFARQGEYDRYAMIRFSQGERDVTVSATATYFGDGFATWDLVIPDLSGVSGFNTAWGLRRGVQTDWAASAYGWSGNGFLFLAPQDGTTIRTAQRSGKATP
jgi:uncharacterized membrane protein